MKRQWREARAKVTEEGRCRVCHSTDPHLEAAHLVSRARVRPGADWGGGEHPLNIVPLCSNRLGGNSCHARFDDPSDEFDLLPHLSRDEQAYAVLIHPGGLTGALDRLTGKRAA